MHDLPLPLGWASKSVYEAVCQEGGGEMSEQDFRWVSASQREKGSWRSGQRRKADDQCGAGVADEEAGARRGTGLERSHNLTGLMRDVIIHYANYKTSTTILYRFICRP